MATTRTVQTASLTPVAPGPFTADGTGDKFALPAAGPLFMRIINGAGASITATIADQSSVTPEGASAFTPNVAVAVPAGSSRVIKLTDYRRFTSTTDGLVSVTWSSATSVTFELWQ